MTSRLSAIVSAAVVCLTPGLAGQSPADTTSPVLDAMKVELARSLAALRAGPTPPYFLGYDITAQGEETVTPSFGAITYRADERRRALDVQLPVVSCAFDNTHADGGADPDFRMLLDSP